MPKENIGVKDELTPKPCKVFESDTILSSPEEIEYYKACIKEFEARNLLIGHIDDDANYVIDEDLRKNLALMPKEQTNEGFNLIEAHALVMNKDMFFTIEIEETDQELTQSLTASLYLIEKVQGYKNLQTIRSFIARITQPFSKTFTDTAKKVFNIQPSVAGTNYDEYTILNKRLKSLSDDWNSLNEIVDLSSQIYVMRMLQLLEQEGPLGQKILEEYYKTLKEDGLDKGAKAGRYIEVRKVLDEIIEQYGGQERVFVNTKEEVKKVKQEYVEPIKKVEQFRQKQEAKAKKIVIEDKKEEVKQLPKKAEEKKPAAKVAGKSGGSKPAKKPAKKAKKKPAAKKEEDKDKKPKGLNFGKIKMEPKVDAAKLNGKGGIKTQIPLAPKIPNIDKPAQKPGDNNNADALFNDLLSTVPREVAEEELINDRVDSLQPVQDVVDVVNVVHEEETIVINNIEPADSFESEN